MKGKHGSSSARLATVGYEGVELEAFIELLGSNGIAQLVDVRELPLSRKKGFSKTALAEALGRHGIRYVHMRGLGAPRSARHALRRHGDFDRFAGEYRKHLLHAAKDIDALKATAARAPTAIMCFERDHETCHRGLIAENLAAEGVAVVHLHQ